jgi:uncharacterized protein (DUF952 family)
MNNEYIFHLCDIHDWEIAQKNGEYLPTSFPEGSFIHCSTSAQIIEVANRYYPNHHRLCTLVINPEKVTAVIKWEQVGDEVFPHIYGALNVDAVIDIRDMPVDEDGVYRIHPMAGNQDGDNKFTGNFLDQA